MKVAIYGQFYQNDTRPIIKDIFIFFNKKNVTLIIEKNFLDILHQEQLLQKNYETFSCHEDLDDSIDLFLSIGGDGTILRSVTFVQHKKIPILGINAGRLGFLAKVQKENIDVFLQMVIDKNYTLSQRSVLRLKCTPKNSDINTINFALNEITVSRKDTTSMITIETYLDGEYLTSYWADGLIVSTPTGSTGYSLSCGGPILTPDVKSFVITPIAPHNLNARPLVIPDKTVVKLKISGREDQYLVSLDSRIATLDKNAELIIKKANFKVNMIEIREETFLQTLRKKMLWGEDKRN